jgi:hypothetical protein
MGEYFSWVVHWFVFDAPNFSLHYLDKTSLVTHLSPEPVGKLDKADSR